MAIPDCVFIDVQDFVHARGVIRSGIDESRTVMIGSYMSVVVQSHFDACSMEMLDHFGTEALCEAATAFRHFGYLGVSYLVLAILIEDLVERYPNHQPVDPNGIGEFAIN